MIATAPLPALPGSSFRSLLWPLLGAALLATAASAASDPGALEDRFRLFVSGGGDTLLLPERDDADYETIELREGRVHVDGELWSDSALERAIGADDAEAILGLLGRTLDEFSIEIEVDEENESVSVDFGAGGAMPGISVRSRDEVVRVGGDVHVAADERVEGDVVAVMGSVHIEGRVEGDVVAVMGSVRLGDAAEVEGDAVAVGGKVHQTPGARVHGDVVNASFFGAGVSAGASSGAKEHRIVIGDDEEDEGGELLLDLARMLVLGLLACAVHLVAPGPVRRVEAATLGASWKALLVGLLVEVFFLPVFVVTVVVLAISIIGIPVLLLFVPAALLAISLALLLGWAGVAGVAGRWVAARFDWDWAKGRFGPFMLGAAALIFLTLIADMLSFVGGLLGPVAVAVAIAGFLVEYAAWTGGLGAVVLTRFGTRGPGEGGTGGSFTGGGGGGVHYAPDDGGLFDAGVSNRSAPSRPEAPVPPSAHQAPRVYAPPEPAQPGAGAGKKAGEDPARPLIPPPPRQDEEEKDEERNDRHDEPKE